ncbi:hypothetical protein CCO03_08045 [Comamonas serinivorans]|uniref:DUF2239 domain-containing protein n=1 Tax=Comamonas serinivorans TaxID=1082851 RepID=A0A1Y0EMK0_9BURK|nr:DUF2239 family protein [Comamonas serinivorans]ARU04628.1 hypothetical protein CCO03_08045 [Comamonas serinivorans]
MNAMFPSHYTAFAGDRRVAQGRYAEIAEALAAVDEPAGPILVFDDATGAPVDTPPRPEHAALLARLAPTADAGDAGDADAGPAPAPSSRPAPGRPRLGVVAREVTLLPRHWDWLARQPGGASAALRRLVDHARKSTDAADDRRHAAERGYKFMSAIAGHQPGFEDAARALFAADAAALARCTAAWPPDVRAHLAHLAQGVFTPHDDDAGTP